MGSYTADPRHRVISIADIGFAEDTSVPEVAADAKEAKEFSLNELPELAFDHDEIIKFA
jgi:8-oxo-dGTP diphosphatase